jgi:hypothetical protein
MYLGSDVLAVQLIQYTQISGISNGAAVCVTVVT